MTADDPLIIVEENHDLPLVRLVVALRSGAGDDPPGQGGLTSFASTLLARGAGGRSRADLDLAFDALGGALEVTCDCDATFFEVTVLRDRLEPALSLIADALIRPELSHVEAEKVKRELAAALDELGEDDRSLAHLNFDRAIYGEHPYGRSALGTAESVALLDVDAASAWHRLRVSTGQMVVGLAGAVEHAEATALISRYLSDLPRSERLPLERYPAPPTRTGMRLTVVDKPARTQSQILLGHPGPQWGTDEFIALQVATCAYGGAFTSRLVSEIRSKRGLSYEVSARIGQGRSRHPFMLHVCPSLDQTVETLELVLGLHAEWLDKGITKDELRFAQGYVANSFAFSVATPEDRLEMRAWIELCGLRADHAARFPERVRAVTLEETQRAIAALRASDPEICIVSTADELLPRLERAGLANRFQIEIVTA